MRDSSFAIILRWLKVIKEAEEEYCVERSKTSAYGNKC
jgi:hypothetical protein